MNAFFNKISQINQTLLQKEVFYDNGKLIEKEKTQSTVFALQRQFLEFLTQYYACKTKTNYSLNLLTKMWQYEALLFSLIHAKKNSYFYSKKLDADFPDFYRELLKNARKQYEKCIENIHDEITTEENIKKIEENTYSLLENLPFTISEEIAQNCDAFLAMRHDDISAMVSVESSGTSLHLVPNSRKRIYCSENDLENTIAFFYHGMQYLLQNPQNKVALLMSGERLGSVGHLLKEAMDRLKINCEVFGFIHDFNIIIEKLEAFMPTCIIGVPSDLVRLSYYAKNANFVQNINSVLLSGDVMTDNLCAQIARNFTCEVFQHYGLTECGLGGAVAPMPYQNNTGLEYRCLDLLIEILNEKGQRIPQNNLQNGEMGEIVITTLSREAMPLVRYKTGDIGTFLNSNQNNSYCTKTANLKVLGRKYSSIKFAKEKTVHIAEIQDFFYQYNGLIDFDICIAINSLQEEILLLGIEIEKNSPLDFSQLQIDFAFKFRLMYTDISEVYSFRSSDGIEKFSLLEKKDFYAFLEKYGVNFLPSANPKKSIKFLTLKEDIYANR